MARDPVTGRFVKTSNTPESTEGKFSTYADGLPVSDASGAPSPNTILYPHHGPKADELAQGGQGSPLRARNATLVHPDDADHEVYGRQGAVLRSAARRFEDPAIGFLVGLDVHGSPATGVKDGSDGLPLTTVYGDGGRTMSPTRAEDIRRR